jgi:hypothetical protein
LCAAVLSAAALPAQAADNVLDAIDKARKAYQAGDMATARQTLDQAAQLIVNKVADSLVPLLPAPLTGWTAVKAEADAAGVATASRSYTNVKDDSVDISITADPETVTQMATMLKTPADAATMGKPIRVGSQSALQSEEGDITLLVAKKYLVTVSGSADAATKMTYARAIDVAKLSKM